MELNYFLYIIFIGDIQLGLHKLIEDIIQLDNKDKHVFTCTSNITYKVHANNLFNKNDQSIFINELYLRWYPLGDYNVSMKGESRAKTSLWRRARGQQGHSNPRVLIKKRISYIYIYFFNQCCLL